MDEATVREHAETHAQATVERNYEVAGSYLSEDAMANASSIMRELPRRLTSAEVRDVERSGNAFTCTIRYEGDDGAATVESRWEDVGGRPTIVALAVVEKD